MIGLLDVISIVGAIGTVLVSTATLFTTRALQRSQQKATIMANKRGDRIDLLREFSAGIISCGKYILHNLADENTKRDLISYTDKFISLLQYEYPHDIELIDNANRIVELSLFEKVDMDALAFQLREFWKKCDIYVGVEYERLKVESMGDINGSGKISDESQTFENIYTMLAEGQGKSVASKK